MVRLEDLDVGRVREEYVESQLEDLRWLGLDWDEGPDVDGGGGPYRQSLRQGLYDEAIDELRRQGLVYDCFCTRSEIAAAAAAPHSADEGPKYPGTCRNLPAGFTHPGPAALRFRTPPGEVCFVDSVYGTQCSIPSSEVGDFVVRRKDGVPAYQLAVVVDDAAMEITDVLRGADLLPSTARQLLLYDALGLQPPRWTHVPLLRAVDGDRLSKRSNALSLRELREAGIDSDRVVGWLAGTAGLAAPASPIPPAQLIEHFHPSRLDRRDTFADFPDWLRKSQ